jgi:hypothetical protein
MIANRKMTLAPRLQPRRHPASAIEVSETSGRQTASDLRYKLMEMGMPGDREGPPFQTSSSWDAMITARITIYQSSEPKVSVQRTFTNLVLAKVRVEGQKPFQLDPLGVVFCLFRIASCGRVYDQEDPFLSDEMGHNLFGENDFLDAFFARSDGTLGDQVVKVPLEQVALGDGNGVVVRAHLQPLDGAGVGGGVLEFPEVEHNEIFHVVELGL